MASKPTSLPRWADISGSIVEPSSGKKDVGHEPNEQPPAEHLNWLFNLLYQWADYLGDLENQSLTWTLSHVFSRVITLGNNFTGSEANAITPRLTVEPVNSSVADWTRIAKFKDAGLWIKGAGSSSEFALTVNADRTTDASDKWKKITSGAQALIVQAGRDRLRFGTMPAAQNTDWVDSFLESGEGTAAGGWGSIFNFASDSESDSNAQSDVAKIADQMSTTAGTERVALFNWRHATLGNVRAYYLISNSQGDAGGLEISVNAAWGNSGNLWTRDVLGTSAKYVLTKTRFGFFFSASGAAGSTFADNAFSASPINFEFQTGAPGASGDENRYKIGNGFAQFVGTQSTSTDDANPPSGSMPGGNCLHAKNICKSWGNIDISAGGSGTVNDGYNVSGISTDTGADTITVSFAVAMQNANYSVNVTPKTGIAQFAVITAQTTTGFTLQIYNVVNSATPLALVNIGVNGCAFNFQVFGRQDT